MKRRGSLTFISGLATLLVLALVAAGLVALAIWVFPNGQTTAGDLAEVLAVASAAAFFSYRLASSELNPNLSVAGSARRVQGASNEVIRVTLTLTKGDVGGLRVTDIYSALRTPDDASAVVPVHDAAAVPTFSEVQPGATPAWRDASKTLALVRGESTTLSWFMASTQTGAAVVDVVVFCERHPIPFRGYTPQWRVSFPVE